MVGKKKDKVRGNEGGERGGQKRDTVCIHLGKGKGREKGSGEEGKGYKVYVKEKTLVEAQNYT